MQIEGYIREAVSWSSLPDSCDTCVFVSREHDGVLRCLNPSPIEAGNDSLSGPQRQPWDYPYVDALGKCPRFVRAACPRHQATPQGLVFLPEHRRREHAQYGAVTFAQYAAGALSPVRWYRRDEDVDAWVPA